MSETSEEIWSDSQIKMLLDVENEASESYGSWVSKILSGRKEPDTPLEQQLFEWANSRTPEKITLPAVEGAIIKQNRNLITQELIVTIFALGGQKRFIGTQHRPLDIAGVEKAIREVQTLLAPET